MPPILGIDMIVDLGILIAGLISCLLILKKGTSAVPLGEWAQALNSTRLPPPPWHEEELPPSPEPEDIPLTPSEESDEFGIRQGEL